MRYSGWAVAVLGLGLAAPAVAAETSATSWVHVRVEEAAKASKVSVNLPLSVVGAMLRAAPEKVVAKGQVHVGDHGHMSVSELRKAWQDLQKAGDAEIVNVQDKDETVSIRRAGDKLLVNVDKATGKEQVRVEIPARVVDAFFSGQGEEVNIAAALAELEKARGELVKVDDKDSSVRIWIDERP